MKFSSAYVVFAVSVVAIGGVQLWENGPYWAEYNVGASKPEEYGYYFWWGDTVGYEYVGSGWSAVDGSVKGFSFKRADCPIMDTRGPGLEAAGYVDNTGNLVARYDAATKHFGEPWRMPTQTEWVALITNCTTTWTTRNGAYGRLVTGKGVYASKSIFLPAAGMGRGYDFEDYRIRIAGYWSSTVVWDDHETSYCLCFDSGVFERGTNYRYLGRSVRPLRDPAQ